MDAGTGPLRPLVLWLAPLNTKVATGLRPDRFSAKEIELVEGVECLRIEAEHRTLWLNPARDYVVVRWASYRSSGALMHQCDITYSSDDEYGWVPKTWHHMRLAADGVTAEEETRATVTRYEIGVPLKQSDFTISVPPDWEETKNGSEHATSDGRLLCFAGR